MSEKETTNETNNNHDDETAAAAAMKSTREKLETRIAEAHNTQLELISSLQSLIPDLIPSLSLSLQISSLFNLNRPFDPLTPSVNPLTRRPKRPRPSNPIPSLLKPIVISPDLDSTEVVGNNPFLVVRSMVAVCLMERVPFSPIDSSTLLRKLENNDRTLTDPEKAALRTIDSCAVEAALRSMADDNGGVELEEFEVSGKSRVMVMGIDRTSLLKELPESKQNGNKGPVLKTQI